MKKIYFVRHGESEYNVKGFDSGNLDVKLTSFGQEQALKTAQLLKDKNITYIISSNLSRAYDTALIIKNIIDPKDLISLEVNPLLEEVFSGDIQGKPYSGSGMIYGIETGTGESPESLYNRACSFIKHLSFIDTKGSILVVGHQSFSSIVFAVNEGKAKKDFIRYRLDWNFKNGDIKEFNLASF